MIYYRNSSRLWDIVICRLAWCKLCNHVWQINVHINDMLSKFVISVENCTMYTHIKFLFSEFCPSFRLYRLKIPPDYTILWKGFKGLKDARCLVIRLSGLVTDPNEPLYRTPQVAAQANPGEGTSQHTETFI